MSDEREPNDRSDAALRERLELAAQAVPKGEKTIWTADFASPHETCVRDAFTERILTMEDYTDQATAAHIAASSPDVVRADIEEILQLREEVARLNREADWFIEYIWNKDIFRCPMPEGYKCEHKFKHICCLDSEETEIRGRCWREAARKAVEKEERHG